MDSILLKINIYSIK